MAARPPRPIKTCADLMAPEPTSTTTPPATDAEPLSVGEVIAERYRITEHLGSGGFGQVVAADDLHGGRRVAVKILRADAGSRDPAAVARMRQEAEILEAIDHPNIVEIYDVGVSDQGRFMVMELLEGHSIDQVLADEGPANSQRVRPLVKQLLEALSAAHQKQVLHRDIKPENIILVDSPDGEQAKLLDFGIAKAQELLDDDPDEGITLVKTRGGGFVGTPRYCAPEIAVGDPADASADLFSLGLVLAEWLTGRSRIDAEKQNQVLALLIQPEPLDVCDCPELWQPWLARMIAKDPGERYASAEEALGAFSALVEGEGDDVDLAQTVKQPAVAPPSAVGPAPVSETAPTQVRDKPSFANMPASSQAPAPGDQDSLSKSVLGFVLVAAVSCAIVLLLLILARSFFS